MINVETIPILGLENIPSFKKGSGIHIKKKNRGKFTKSAKAAGESVQEHAAHVLSDPNATPLQKKRANFARNAAKWKHQWGGPIYNSTQWADDWKKRLDSPVLKARQLQEQTNKTPVKYIGGNKDAARKEFWNQEPVFQHAVDSIANQYGISPESLKYRLDREGFTDYNIKRRNARVKKGHQQFEPRGYQLLNNSMYKLAGTQMGLDDAKTYIDSGEVKLINEKWFDQGTFKNEKGRITYPVEPATLNDGMGIVAAHLKYFKDKAQKDFPNASEYDLNRYSNAYYNRGAYGGKQWVKSGANGYNYK